MLFKDDLVRKNESSINQLRNSDGTDYEECIELYYGIDTSKAETKATDKQGKATKKEAREPLARVLRRVFGGDDSYITITR